MIDQFYTPNWLAKKVAQIIPKGSINSVMDPTAGDGSLLTSVKELHPEVIDFLATDINTRVFGLLKQRNPTWTFGKIDIFNSRSRSASSVWKLAKSKGLDLVVCNPPYSYKAKRGKFTEFLGKTGITSPAANVCASVLSEIAPRNGMIALLPSSTFHAEIDEWFWTLAKAHWDVEVVEILNRSTFSSARAETYLVRIVPVKKAPVSPMDVPILNSVEGCKCVTVSRGNIQMHSSMSILTSTGYPLVHTTNLSSGVIKQSDIYVQGNRVLSQSSVLIPRVGSFRSDKICWYEGENSIILSDCIISIRCLTKELTKNLHERMNDLSFELSLLYKGTGAPYVTVSRIEDFLFKNGYNILKNGASNCTCSSIDLSKSVLSFAR